MNCWIVLFHICAFSPEEVYVRGDLSTAIGGHFQYWDSRVGRNPQNFTNQPTAHLELGWKVDLNREWSMRIFAFHESKPMVNDRGQERMGISVEWRPFR